MPWTKITRGSDKGKYRSPSGRVWTLDQIRAYEAKKRSPDRKRRTSRRHKKGR